MESVSNLLHFSKKNRLPVIFQSEASECGLVCVLMIAAYYGHKIDLATARSQFSVSSKGLNLKGVIDIAQHLHLQARPIRAELAYLQKMNLPAIVHWNLNHFVVLSKITDDYAVIHDPAKGKVKLKISDFSLSFTGVAVELFPTNDFKRREEVTSLKISDFWSNMTGLKRNIVSIFILSLALQLFAIAAPLLQQVVVDDAISNKDNELLIVLCIGFFLVNCFQQLISYLRSKISLYFTNLLGFQLSANLTRHMLRLPISFFEKRTIGDITTRFSSLGPIESLLTSGLIAIVLDSVMFVVALLMSFLYSAKLTMIVICLLFIGFVIDLVVFPYRKSMEEKIIELSAKESTVFLENIRAAKIIKIFGQETCRERIWLNRKADFNNSSIELANFDINFGFFVSFFGIISSVMMLYIGAQMVIKGEFTIGMLFAYQAYSGQFSGRLSALFGHFLSFKMLNLHLTRLSDIAHHEAETNTLSSAGYTQLPDNKISTVRFENLSFRYADNEPWVLKDVNVEINDGDMLAFVGPSGQGKSTLLKLLIGLLKPTEGAIYINNIDLTRLDPNEYRKMLGVIMQDDSLLSGTIRENITFFDQQTDEEALTEAAKIACIDGDILKFPMGYNTLVGEMGSALSGGQKQRIYFARAIYRKPNLLMLDEGTANLDVPTEIAIANTIKAYAGIRIVVAHRPALVEIASRVFLVDNTRVIEFKEIGRAHV